MTVGSPSSNNGSGPNTNPNSVDKIWLRVAAAFVLMPIVVGGVFVGGRIFVALVAFMCVVMLYEWTRLVEGREFSNSFYALCVSSAFGFFAAGAGAYPLAYALVAFGAIAAFIVRVFDKSKTRAPVTLDGTVAAPWWSPIAVPYFVMPCLALIWLRAEVPNGRAFVFFLFFVVWAADSGAYFFGKFLGGPKMAPALSPKKTWTGVIGGVLCGGIIGAISSQILFAQAPAFAFLISGAALGGMSVLGDLAESIAKRYFGKKDISGFIPGHGGALDRLDGMIFATIALSAVLYAFMFFEQLL